MMIRLIGTLMRRIARAQNGHSTKVVLLTVAVTAYAASGFLFFEQVQRPDLTWSDAFWWAFVTMTTVGYGDYFPETVGGRYLIGFPTMLIGISILGYILSAFAQSLLEAYSRELKGMATLQLKNHVLIIHYPSAARVHNVIHELSLDAKTADAPVVVVDEHLEELPEELRSRGVAFVKGDPALEETLKRANLGEARVGLILAPNPLDHHSDHYCLAVALTVEALNPSLHSVVECVSPDRVELMRRAGVDSVVCISHLASALVVQEALDPGALDVVAQMASNQTGEQLYLVELKSTGPQRFADASERLSSHRMLAIGVRDGHAVRLNPPADEAVQPGMLLICLGRQRLSELRMG